MRRKKYSKEQKREAARLVIDSGDTISSVSKNLGINQAVLGRWVAEEKEKLTKVYPDVEKLIEENKRLKKDNIRLEKEREFLKKTALFFAQEGK